MKKILSIVLSLAMILGTMSFSVMAAGVSDAEALAAAVQEGGEIVLEGSIEISEALVIPEGKVVTIDLNRNTITGTMHKSDGHVITNNGTLYLKNGTVSSTAENGGSAVCNYGIATVEAVTLNGAPNAGGSWPAYTVNNYGTMTISDSFITSCHGGVASSGDGAVVTLVDSELNMSGIPGFSSHGFYTSDKGGKIIVNGGTYVNHAEDQSYTGGSVINGTVEVLAGHFGGRIENYYGTPAIYGGTFDTNNDGTNDKPKFIAENSEYDSKTGEVIRYVAKIGNDKYTSLHDALSLAGMAGAGDTEIEILSDIDLKNVEWKPITVDGYHGADIVTIKGNNHTITNLSAPLFAGGFAGGSGIVISDLTISDSDIVSTNAEGSGAFIESVDSMDVITLKNCHLLDSTVTGSRTGGLIGWTSGYNNPNDGPVKTYVTITDCTVKGCTITGTSVGAINGHAGANAWTYTTIEDCVIEDNDLISTDGGGWRVGVVVGTANVGQVSINGITESENTLTQAGKTMPEGQTNLIGRYVPSSDPAADSKLVIDGVPYASDCKPFPVKIGEDKYFATLQAAVDAAVDGDVIDVTADITIEEKDAVTSGNWKYGVLYTGDKSFTIDLKGNTITDKNASNDYFMNFKNLGEKDNEITIKNGSIISGDYAYSAICLGSSANTHTTTLNTEDLYIEKKGLTDVSNNGVVMKIREGVTWNAKAGTEILGDNTYGAMEVSAATANLYDGVEVTVQNTELPWGPAVAVSKGGTINVYGGSYESDTYGAYVLSSGGTINIKGGTFDAKTALKADNWDEQVTSDSVINIENGTFTGTESIVWVGGYVPNYSAKVNIKGGTFIGDKYDVEFSNAELVITGGTFSTLDASDYLAPGLELAPNGDRFTVVTENTVAEAIEVVFEDLTDADAEGEKLYNINLVASDSKIINRLNSGDLTFKFVPEDGKNVDFEIIDIANDDITVAPVDNSDVRYRFNFDTKTDVDNDTANTITIAQVKFEGYGKFSFMIDATAVDAKGDFSNAVHTTKLSDNIVDTFVVGGGEGKGELIINNEAENTDNDDEYGYIDDVEITVPTRELTINITFPNTVENNAWEYQDMTVTIVGGTVNEPIDLGIGGDDDDYIIKKDLPYNTPYTVTVKGAGYRTARYTVTMTEDKTLNFWNNVKDADKQVEVEEGVANSAKSKNFLAGDIVKDNNINIYDLSAVVSYFNTATNTDADDVNAKYDLNRDGIINSKDVAYVLVSWGE